MADGQSVTCEIRYKLNLSRRTEFESYARTWMHLIERYGGTHHGYFLPRAAPEGAAISFPGIGRDGPDDVAVALFSFPDEHSYQRYRAMAAADPECRTAEALVRETHCFLSYERLFLHPIERMA